jgi:hypothetical protein
MLAAWLLIIVTGATTTGLLRTPVGGGGLGPRLLVIHAAAGAVVAAIVAIRLLRLRTPGGTALAVAIGSVIVTGLSSSRSFAPPTVATHAAVAALGAAVAAAMPRVTPAAARSGGAGAPGLSWRAAAARLAFGLMLLQVVLGALLRHHLVGLGWHLLGAGLAALATLVAAVAVAQEQSATAVERRAAVWAIESLLIQVTLGLGVLALIFISTPNAYVWLFTTIAHVVVASLTLVATLRLARAVSGPGAGGS